ncbi:MAG: arylsulfatase [Akkermansia sp.]
MKSFLLSLFLTLCMGSVCSQAKPNIVLINADDLGWAEIGCFGQKKIKTPNLDKLGKEGQRWVQFYSGAPVCSPSRNVLMTGRHTGCNDVQDLKRVDDSENLNDLRGDWPISENVYTLPDAMKKAGYATALFGKWGLGDFGTTGAPDKHGIDTYYGYTDQRACHSYYPPFLWNNGKKEVINNPGIPGHKSQPKGEVLAETYRGQQHASDLIADKMLDFVKKKAAEKQPFFLYYAPLEPHVAMQPLQKWIDLYPAEWDTKPYRGGRGYLPHPRPRAAYAGMISQMDANVGRLMDTLKQCGLDENTIVVFTSDNGTTHDSGGADHRFFYSVKELRGLKGQMYEGGIRVPGIVRWTGKIKANKEVNQAAYHADLMPTLCALVNADPGKECLGVNLSPVWLGKTATLKDRKPMVWTGGGYGGQVAVRIGDKKAVRRNLFPRNTPTNWEVYDVTKDPNENNNIAATQREVIDQAKAILDKEYKPAKGFTRLKYDAPEVTKTPKIAKK